MSQIGDVNPKITERDSKEEREGTWRDCEGEKRWT